MAADSQLRTRIKRFASSLAQRGFVLSRPRFIARDSPGIRQGLDFQPGSGYLSGKFTVNVVWTFTLALPATGFHGWRRIGELAGSQDIWFSRLSDQIEVQFAAAEALITEYALPYLDTFASIESLVTGYERGSISGAHAFGGDSGWRALNLGLCYAFLGRRADAEARLKEVVEVHSDEEFDFVMERKRLALAELERLDRT